MFHRGTAHLTFLKDVSVYDVGVLLGPSNPVRYSGRIELPLRNEREEIEVS